MTDIENRVLGMCLICKKIRVGDKNDLWLKREDNPVLYDRLCEAFQNRISHGYCPEDFQKFIQSCDEEMDKYCKEKNN